MNYLSVCSGIEAATAAWHGLGWKPVAFSEIDPFPAAVLAHHYAAVPNLGDMTNYLEWPEELLADVDLLVGGTPCQAFSVAGQRRSLGDERGNLSLVYVNLYHHINEVRKRHGRPPVIAVWENVPGVLSTKDNAFGCFIGGLLGCDEAPATESGKWDKAGFLSSETVRVGYRVLDAQYFGVAQRRRRVFLVAVPCELVERFGERACPSEILSLRESVLGNPPTRGAAWEGTSRATASGLTSSGRGVERPGESRGQDDVVIDCRPVAGTLDSNYHKGCGERAGVEREVVIDCRSVAFGGNRSRGPLDVATSCLANGSPHGRQDFASETFVVEGYPDTAYAISAGQQGKGGVFGSGRDSQDTFVAVAFKPGQSEAAGGTFVTDEFTPTMQSQNNGSTAVPAVAFKPSHFTRGKVENPTMQSLRSSAEYRYQFIRNAMQVRRLCPSECEALQGFPIGYTDVQYRKKPAADGPRYRALGNSMAVPCMWWIGIRISQAIGRDFSQHLNDSARSIK